MKIKYVILILVIVFFISGCRDDSVDDKVDKYISDNSESGYSSYDNSTPSSSESIATPTSESQNDEVEEELEECDPPCGAGYFCEDGFCRSSGGNGGNGDDDNTNTQESTQDIVTEEEYNSNLKEICDGCFYDNSCINIGIRFEGKYCDVSGDVLDQKAEEEQCENDFECESNICKGEYCVSTSTWNRFLDFFQGISQ